MEPIMMHSNGGLNLEKKIVPEGEIYQIWTEIIFANEIAEPILKLEPTDVSILNVFQDKFDSEYLIVIPCKNCNLRPEVHIDGK